MREYLKAIRILHGMTMQDVADKLGISRQYYEMIESGDRQRKMDITLISGLSVLFSVSMEEIAENEKALYPEIWEKGKED